MLPRKSVFPGHLSFDTIDAAIVAGRDFLSRMQLPEGEFCTYEFSDPMLNGPSRFGSSPFATSLIVYSLGFLEDGSESMIGKALDFLERQSEELGVWRYWSKENTDRTFLPPDLDDTCCASFCLRRHGRAVPDNLPTILGNAAPDGTFYTWIAPRSESVLRYWDKLDYWPQPEQFVRLMLSGLLYDVDCVTNANVVLYLGDRHESSRAIEYLLQAVETKTDSDFSRYYVHVFSYYYMLSRAYFTGVSALAGAREPVARRILRSRTDGQWLLGPLESALAVSTLLNFGEGHSIPSAAVRKILESQRDDGSWQRETLFKGAGRVPGPYYGSEELTTGFCLEALARYRKLVCPPQQIAQQ